MVEEVHCCGVDWLSAFNGPAPRAGLHHKADALLGDVTSIEVRFAVVEVEDCTVKIVALSILSARHWLESAAVDRIKTQRLVVVNENDLIEELPQVKFFDAQIVAVTRPSPTGWLGAFGRVPDVIEDRRGGNAA